MTRDEKMQWSPRPSLMNGWVPVGDARQGRAVLALAAGAEIQDLVGRPVAGLVLGQECAGVVGQHADVFGGGGDAVHRAAGQGDAASGRLGGA